MNNELKINDAEFNTTPAYIIDDLKNKIDNNEATPEEIEEYIDFQVDMQTREMWFKAQQELTASYNQAKLQAQEAEATSARLNLKTVAYDAIKRFNDE